MSVVLAALTAATLSLGAAPLALADPGHVRLAHLSPDTPAVDVYLYEQGRKSPRLVLKHVGYGAASPYQRLPVGAYTVAMRPADAAASSPPVLSADVRVRSGAAYTVAGMGPYKSVRLQVLDDSFGPAGGNAGLRVIAASLKRPAVDVVAGDRMLARGLRFPDTTPYRSLPAGTTTVRVRGTAAASDVRLAPGSLGTVVVLDGTGGPRLLHLRDTVPPRQEEPPRGGVAAGSGGAAGGAPLAGVVALGLLALLLYRVRPGKGIR
ncbi:DUF4397 domain-containing protein [Actinomadura craniellae]|uniref:DUF4397 domain-containing protein n=1 Tax=Actinomadura craniellae TaxID=2231787 RepID=A0A365H8I4_9ACTN|nr:DUF4397 domain-containing protein [Actinomadura craniellae]RAY14573.1 DUF4397 domain-containing protein [Actinomadura craniellae]